MPTVSVIIPIYNTGKYIAETLKSVLYQNIEDMEIICVNDGSTDNSLDIINEFADHDSRIRIYTQQNQGQSVARNTGLLHAKGKYVYLMDSDDVLKPNCFEQCLTAMEKNKYDFLFFDGDTFCENGTSNICWNYHRTDIYDENTVYVGEILMHSQLDNYTYRAVPWLLFIRHEYIKKLSLSFYPGIIHEDELFTTLLTIQANKVGCIKQSLIIHRIRANSTITTRYSRKNVDCYIIVIDELMKWGEKNPTQRTLLKKYACYTLDKVLYTAHVLPSNQKISITKKIICKKYHSYISLKNWLRFLIK